MMSYRLIIAICATSAPGIVAADVEVELTIPRREITICSPIPACVMVKNLHDGIVRLETPLTVEAGGVQFYARHTDSKEFRSIPGALYYEDIVGGGGEIKKSESRAIYTFLVPHEQDSFFDRPGEWELRAKVGVGKIEGRSATVRLTVKPGKGTTHELFELNEQLCRSLGSRDKFNSKYIGQIIESPIAGEELRTMATWVDAISRVTEAPDEGLLERYKAACEIQSHLDKTSQALMATQFALRLVHRGKGDIAKEQALKLDVHTQQKIQYSIDERRRNLLESKRSPGTD